MSEETNTDLLRLKQVLTIIPVSKSTFWAGVKDGKFPTPVKLGRCTFWRSDEIYALIEQASAAR